MFIVDGNVVYKRAITENGSEVTNYHSCVNTIKLELINDVVKATVLNYMGEVQSGYSGSINFKCENETIEVQAINGTAEITIAVPQGEVVTVCTMNGDMTNGEVTING